MREFIDALSSAATVRFGVALRSRQEGKLFRSFRVKPEAAACIDLFRSLGCSLSLSIVFRLFLSFGLSSFSL